MSDLDQGNSGGSPTAEKVTPAPLIDETLENLAESIKGSTIDICAKVAAMHFISAPENTYQDGWNAAVEAIERRIRRLL
jgi:hypothetical protein